MDIQIIGYIGLIVFTAVGLWFAYKEGKKSGVNSIQVESAKRLNDVIRISNEIEKNVRSLSDSELDERLSKYIRKK